MTNCILQAAASGQPDVDFAEEDINPQDSAREDLRCLVRGKSSLPQEVKREYATAHADGSDDGIHRNRPALAKVRNVAGAVAMHAMVHRAGEKQDV